MINVSSRNSGMKIKYLKENTITIVMSTETVTRKAFTGFKNKLNLLEFN